MEVKQKIPHRSYSGVKWTTIKSNKKRLIKDFDNKCAYCDDSDKYAGGSKMYHVEHFAPKDKFPELKYRYDNLLYACPFCNISKSNKWPSDQSNISVVGNRGFVDPCTQEYNKHLIRKDDGAIGYITPLGEYMFFELKLYLQRHQLLYNLNRMHLKLKEVRYEIERRKRLHKAVDNLETLYKELCTVFYEYYDFFSKNI